MEKGLKPLLTDDEGYVQFYISVDDDVEHYMSFKLYEVETWECDEAKTPAEMEVYLHGTIKWDGCSHVWFGDTDDKDNANGYLHLCGKRYWERHCQVMMLVYKMAEETIKNYDAEIAA